MSRQPTIIYSAENPQQAHLLRSLLEDEGIQAWVVNDAIQIAGGELPVGWRAAAKVAVRDEQAAIAREFAEAFDHKAQQHFFEGNPDPDEGTEDAPRSAQPAWPVCPSCHQLRSACCPVCNESGTDFPAAYSSSTHTDNDHESLFLCPGCDECISPRWYRLCARCGHDFGEGLEIQKPDSTTISISVRMLTALGVLLSLVAAIAAYFYWLFAKH